MLRVESNISTSFSNSAPTFFLTTTSCRDYDPRNMVKALSFKGDKKSHKKRKRTDGDANDDGPQSKQLVAANGADDQAEEDSWVTAEEVTDISGPIMLVFNSEPVTALACDQMGKVFALKVENIVEDLPDSAEPHDVRQVFVATKVLGTENEYSLKGSQGK